jgi:hypothetical protein
MRVYIPKSKMPTYANGRWFGREEQTDAPTELKQSQKDSPPSQLRKTAVRKEKRA